MNKRNQGDQTRKDWLERSIFNILENQKKLTNEPSKNVSKATAGKCIRDTGADVFTGDAVGHLATIWTREYILDTYLMLPTHGWALALSQHSAHWTAQKRRGTVQCRPMDLLDRSFVHLCHCSVVRVKVNLVFLFPERWTLLKLLSCSTQRD